MSDKQHPIETAKLIFKNAEAICFDVDSTVCVGEAIDEFASFLGVGEQVANLTKKAMGEGLSFRQSLESRLELMNPSKEQTNGQPPSTMMKNVMNKAFFPTQLEEYSKENPPKLTPGIKELVTILHSQKKEVYLVSGGFRSFIIPVANLLDIPVDNLFTNRFIFNEEDGTYLGFDKDQPTSSSGGKKVVAEKLKEKHQSLVMIGDGMTDFEAYPPADLFIGFGGNVTREKVKENSPWFVTKFKELIDNLQS